MAFSQTQFDTVVEEIQKGLHDMPGRIEKFIADVNSLLGAWWMTDPVAKAIRWAAEKLRELITKTVDKIGEACVGIAAPVHLFVKALDWQADIRAKATTVAGQTDSKALRAPLEWTGEAADRYKTATWRQTGAAARVGTIADSVGSSLTMSAGAGLAFYLAIAAIVVELGIVISAASAATATGVGAPIGIGAGIADTLKQLALIVTAIAGITTFVASQATELVSLTGEARDGKDFDGGKWPSGTA
ncbi:hypothetical protein ABZW18_06445 [Streptomyces sp. NPDC004647]|uniref:hypothetical protein n=1 Tax=Streptomyces sp. NPDC004647 TaxID=3154671 RepID=UPI0033AFB679